MKVLFAVSNEETSELIAKEYQQNYKKIISSRNVYYLDGIIKELRKDKTYDRIVISEDVEIFSNNNYQEIDRFIFDKLDAISDEAFNNDGEDIPIILICTDRRTKNDPILLKIFGLGIYSALVEQDRSIEKVCGLLNKPRSKKEAKSYYKVESRNVNYRAEERSIGVNENEIQNILAHYRKIAKNPEKCVESFNRILLQYSEEQVKLIIPFLPLEIKMILEANSSEYVRLVGGDQTLKNKVKASKNIKTKKFIEREISKSNLNNPVIIPTQMNVDRVKKVNRGIMKSTDVANSDGAKIIDEREKRIAARRAAQEKMKRESQERAKRIERLKARREAEEKARKEAEEKARKEAEEKARKEAEEKARKAAEEKARKEAEEKARKEAEEKARKEAEEKARKEAEEKARKEAEEKARKEAEKLEKKAEEEIEARKEAEDKMLNESSKGRGRPRKNPIEVTDTIKPAKKTDGLDKKSKIKKDIILDFSKSDSEIETGKKVNEEKEDMFFSLQDFDDLDDEFLDIDEDEDYEDYDLEDDNEFIDEDEDYDDYDLEDDNEFIDEDEDYDDYDLEDDNEFIDEDEDYDDYNLEDDNEFIDEDEDYDDYDLEDDNEFIDEDEDYDDYDLEDDNEFIDEDEGEDYDDYDLEDDNEFIDEDEDEEYEDYNLEDDDEFIDEDEDYEDYDLEDDNEFIDEDEEYEDYNLEDDNEFIDEDEEHEDYNLEDDNEFIDEDYEDYNLEDDNEVIDEDEEYEDYNLEDDNEFIDEDEDYNLEDDNEFIDEDEEYEDLEEDNEKIDEEKKHDDYESEQNDEITDEENYDETEDMVQKILSQNEEGQIQNKNLNKYESIKASINEINELSELDDDEDEESNENKEEENQIQNINYKPDFNFDNLITGDKKIVSFVGTSKNGTSFIVNNLAKMFSEKGIKTAILDLTKNRNAYYIYTENEEKLRKKAEECLENLQNGIAEGIEINKNLSVYTSLPGDTEQLKDPEKILKTLVENYSLILLDCDFETDLIYYKVAKEIYLVQSFDVLTIQPLTAFLRDLKIKNLLEPEKLRIVINKAIRVNGVTERILIGGMSVYNDPGMTYMTELFDRTKVKYTVIPFEEQIYANYLESLAKCKITYKGYSKRFVSSLNELGNMVYPLISSRKRRKRANKLKEYNNFENNFSSDIQDTLEKMKKKY